jgi:hypothetical protein
MRLFATTLLSEPAWCCYAKAMPMGYSNSYGLSHYKIRSFYDVTPFTVAMFEQNRESRKKCQGLIREHDNW